MPNPPATQPREQLELGAPASIPLALVRLADNAAPCLLCVTVQHPPTQVFARPDTALRIIGARADVATHYARQFAQHHGLPAQGKLDIELATPSHMGLSSEAMVALSTARCLAWLHGLPPTDTPALARALGLDGLAAGALWGFDQGGLLLVETATTDEPAAYPAVAQRFTLEHPKERAWAFVLVLPRVPAATPATLEHTALTNLLHAAPHLPAEALPLTQEALLPALAQDDIHAFGRALGALHTHTLAALVQAGTPLLHTPDEQRLLDLFQQGGAVAWGKLPGGLALYGLIEGAQASIALRLKLRQALGRTGGRVLATITDNRGAHHTLHPLTWRH